MCPWSEPVSVPPATVIVLAPSNVRPVGVSFAAVIAKAYVAFRSPVSVPAVQNGPGHGTTSATNSPVTCSHAAAAAAAGTANTPAARISTTSFFIAPPSTRRSRDRTKGARTMQMAAAEHASVESDPSASAEPPLRQDQPLPRPHGRVAETVRVLDLPDSGADVAVVMRRRDRPDRVVRLHAVHHLVAARAGGPCSNAPQKSRGAEDDEQPNEHVFVGYRTRVRPSSADVDELRDDLAAVDPQFQHRAPRRPPALGRRPRVEDPDTVHELDVRQMGVAEDDGGAAREPSGQPGLAPRHRPRYVHHPDT